MDNGFVPTAVWANIPRLSVIGKQKCSENGNFNAVKTGTGIQ